MTALAVAIVSAAFPGGQLVAGAALGVSEDAGVVNAATCGSAIMGPAATGVDCVANGAIEVGSLGLGSFFGGPSEWAKGKPSTRPPIGSSGRASISSARLSWARGYKVPNPASTSTSCHLTPRLQGS